MTLVPRLRAGLIHHAAVSVGYNECNQSIGRHPLPQGNFHELVGPNPIAAVSRGGVDPGVSSVCPRATSLGKAKNARIRDAQTANRYFRYAATCDAVGVIDRKSRTDADAAK